MRVRQVRFAETRAPGGPGAGRLAETLSRVYVQEGKGPERETVFECCMIELPDRDNQHNISRIPAGSYVLEKLKSSPAFDYEHLWIHEEGAVDAQGRRGIKWHIANFARQLRGCGAPGRRFAELDGDGVLDVTSSEDTLLSLLDTLPAKCELTIENQDEPRKMEVAGLEDVPTETLEATTRQLTVRDTH